MELLEDWKKANIVTVFKKDEADNYRLVSLTSVHGKMIQQLILDSVGV